MHFSTSATAVALLSSLSAAAPSPAENFQVPHLGLKKTFTVQQKFVSGQKVLAPPVQMLKVYQKYNVKAPAAVSTAAKAAMQTGSVVANPQSYDLAYLSQVTVGGQTFNLNFDTGSADLWVYSTLQSSSQTSGRTVYDPSKSRNATALSGQSWKITYGDGSGAGGKVYADTVQIGAVTATSQAVEAATSVSDQFLNDYQSGGLVGLAFSNLNTVRPNQQSTFFDTVKPGLAQKLFTANLKKGAPGSYDFGFIDPSKYTGAITYAPIQSYTGFWQFTMGGYQVGSRARNYTSMGNGIADTGTTLLYLPDDVVNNYYAAITGAKFNSGYGAWTFPCSAALPAFSIGISGTLFTIPGTYMNYAPISNTMCFGGLQSNANIGFSILGDIFLKSVFVIFDQSQSSPRIGFARQSDIDYPVLSNSTVISSSTTTTTSLRTTTTTVRPTTTKAVTTTTSVKPTTTTTTTVKPTTTSVVIKPTTTTLLPRPTTPAYALTTSISTALVPSLTALASSLRPSSSSSSSSSLALTTSQSPSSSTISSSALAEFSAFSSASSKKANNAQTTTLKKTTTTKKTTTKKTTTARKSVKAAACNQKYIAAIKKAHPLQPRIWCKNYKPRSGVTNSPIKNIPSAQAVVKVCKCWLK